MNSIPTNPYDFTKSSQDETRDIWSNIDIHQLLEAIFDLIFQVKSTYGQHIVFKNHFANVFLIILKGN